MPSSVITSYNYEPETASLVIRYVSGLVYRYKEVPEKVFKEFKASGSKGRYLNFHIKGRFSYERVE
ncbi:KTSC domain-containing protein [Flavihumibacter sp. R14]|nr:KTSC domain-containing protein [Flavihumibacter soli]